MSLIKRNENQTGWLPSVFDDMFRTDWLGDNAVMNNIGRNVPAVNIHENDDSFEVEVAAPGKTKKDFDIEVENNILTISSEDKEEKETTDNNGRCTRREFSYSNFRRVFTLPNIVESEKINATYNDGVLKISVPKREEAKAKPKRLIEIK
ncbi:Hsp20/alpha crystallin family protein [Gramella sp. AN32]|uniref:Hsp20/alpha crystallin family protein n=1 Tax=Christiangramia antarctica TaxID=2058158 RepID=A0ABW5X736_9FLAO|nr:Hsp20/alpha crystallin family protein [Gramella sp. AN32]MCM4154573.1 molecular chaperone Hsp20 [Gramella sp. AN32]